LRLQFHLRKGFLEGIYEADEKISFCEAMFCNESKREANAIRLIEIVDKINCEKSLIMLLMWDELIID